MAGKIHFGNILKKIGKSSKFKKEVNAAISTKFNELKEKTLKEFDGHSVTREIEGGTSATNSSGTLGGYGNLFTFIGFSRASTPIYPLRRTIEKAISFRLLKSVESPAQKKIKFNYRVSVPSEGEIHEASPMPWEGGSWVEGVEYGMSNFSYYMYKKFGKGRSGYGLQVDQELRMAIFSPRTYVTGILANFRRNLKAIK